MFLIQNLLKFDIEISNLVQIEILAIKLAVKLHIVQFFEYKSTNFERFRHLIYTITSAVNQS